MAWFLSLHKNKFDWKQNSAMYIRISTELESVVKHAILIILKNGKLDWKVEYCPHTFLVGTIWNLKLGENQRLTHKQPEMAPRDSLHTQRGKGNVKIYCIPKDYIT